MTMDRNRQEMEEKKLGMAAGGSDWDENDVEARFISSSREEYTIEHSGNEMWRTWNPAMPFFSGNNNSCKVPSAPR